MKYAFESPDGSSVYIYFDSEVFKGIERRVYDAGHLQAGPMPYMVQTILNIYGVFEVAVEGNFACIERYDDTEPFHRIAERVAEKVRELCFAGIVPIQRLPMWEFRKRYPGIVAREPPVE
ncbi:MAG TPA: hypothetical protein VFQ72_03580 [Candidatus Paceibacterota bacterium]|nr:hypothetical protein [Candidatus Paceibacterota bacterium]